MRSSCSIGANYIEANESLSKKDFIYRLKISRKETKETIYWLELILHTLPEKENIINNLTKEAIELQKIFSSMIYKLENSK